MNRTLEKAEIAAARLGCEAVALDRAKEALVGARLLVSAVSSGDRLIEPSALRRDLAVLDANYGRPSALVEDAARAGCTLIDGREWLLGQALPAFELFADGCAPAARMRWALRKKRLDGRKNIALIGFPGTGKSAVAEALASISGMTLVDIDKRIEEKAGMPVPELFAAKGEGEFRKMEQAEIEEMSLEFEPGGLLRRRCGDEPVECSGPEEQLPLRVALGRCQDGALSHRRDEHEAPSQFA